ncbi:hypothetical protein, partial [Scandinavium goeteborgense]|uniref:hypothetical protein n=1 Tax=Scandinavium goeteborgense TaxID=1851514 RepID=UPI001B3C814B
MSSPHVKGEKVSWPLRPVGSAFEGRIGNKMMGCVPERLVDNTVDRLRVNAKNPGLSVGVSYLFDAWQFPTLAWGDPTLPSALRR